MKEINPLKYEKVKPIILVDSREQQPLVFEQSATIPAALTTGDYSINGFADSFTIERKSIPDLIASLTRDRNRFTRELERMRGYQFKRLLIEGTRQQIERHEYRSRAKPAAILGSLNAFEIRFNVPVVFVKSRSTAAKRIESWAKYYLREQIKQAQQIIALTEPPEAIQPQEAIK